MKSNSGSTVEYQASGAIGTGGPAESAQVLRRLIIGRLTFAPQADGFYVFSGTGTVKQLLRGVMRNVASRSRRYSVDKVRVL